jgi:hypothetical protein
MKLVFLSVLSVGFCACSGLGQRGMVTIQGRGTEGLTNTGDPLLRTGMYEARQVPKEFAMGYAAGINDQVKREYWQLQDEATAPKPDPPSKKEKSSPEGAINYYPMTLPETQDAKKVWHAPREVVVPIVE